MATKESYSAIPWCHLVFYTEFLCDFLVATKNHTVCIACKAAVRRPLFSASLPRSKIPDPLGILSEKNIELFRGGVRANVCARMCGGGRERERERENRNSAAFIGMWVEAGGG